MATGCRPADFIPIWFGNTVSSASQAGTSGQGGNEQLLLAAQIRGPIKTCHRSGFLFLPSQLTHPGHHFRSAPLLLPTRQPPGPEAPGHPAPHPAEPKLHTLLCRVSPRDKPLPLRASACTAEPGAPRPPPRPGHAWITPPGGPRNRMDSNEGPIGRTLHFQGYFFKTTDRHSPLSPGIQARGGGGGSRRGGQMAGKGVWALAPCLSPCSGAWGLGPSVAWSPWSCPGWAGCQEHLTSPQG